MNQYNQFKEQMLAHCKLLQVNITEEEIKKMYIGTAAMLNLWQNQVIEAVKQKKKEEQE